MHLDICCSQDPITTGVHTAHFLKKLRINNVHPPKPLNSPAAKLWVESFFFAKYALVEGEDWRSVTLVVAASKKAAESVGTGFGAMLN